MIDNNTKVRLLIRIIIVCWASLFLALLVKTCGANSFIIIGNSARFEKLCKFIDNNIILNSVLTILVCYINFSFYYLAILRQFFFNKYQRLIVIGMVVISTVLRALISNVYIDITLDSLNFLIIPFLLVFCLKKPIKQLKENKYVLRVFVALMLNFVFQFISLKVRNMQLKIFDNNTFVSLILSIDLTIMLMLYYLYENINKGGMNMGKWFGLFFGTDKDKLVKMKESRVEKIKTLTDEIAEIDKRLNEIEEKSKEEVK